MWTRLNVSTATVTDTKTQKMVEKSAKHKDFSFFCEEGGPIPSYDYTGGTPCNPQQTRPQASNQRTSNTVCVKFYPQRQPQRPKHPSHPQPSLRTMCLASCGSVISDAGGLGCRSSASTPPPQLFVIGGGKFFDVGSVGASNPPLNPLPLINDV